MKRLDSFKKEGLGLKRDNIVRLEDHNPRWKRVFSDEAYLILHKLNIDSLKLYHCGSTSIPGICAKPIIDIVGSVSNLKELDDAQDVLKTLGYEYKGEYGIKGRRYSVLYDETKEYGFCHLHIFKEGSSEFNDHLSFRDHLRVDVAAAKKYEDFKKSLGLSRDKYSEFKGRIISELLVSPKPFYHPNDRQKILVISGYAVGGKNTNEYVKEKFSNEDVEILDLNDFKVSPYSYNKKIDDDFISIAQKMLEADRVIMATPVYWYAMSGIMKDFIDRFSDLMGGEHKKIGEALYGKKVDLLSTGYDLEIPNGFDIPFNLTATYFGMDFMSVYYKSVGAG